MLFLLLVDNRHQKPLASMSIKQIKMEAIEAMEYHQKFKGKSSSPFKSKIAKMSRGRF